MTKQERCPKCGSDYDVQDVRHNRCPNCGEMFEHTQGQPEQTTSEREREIREQVEAGQLWKVDIKFLLAQLDAAREKLQLLFDKGCELQKERGKEEAGLPTLDEAAAGIEFGNALVEAERVLKEGK